MKRMMTFLAVLFSIGTLCATTYYASPTGSGTGTSYASPTTWASALGKLHASDTLYLLDGTYALSEKQNIGTSKSGTADQRTFIGAYPGAKPVFDFHTQPYGKEVSGHDNVGVSITEGATYIHIKDLTICYAGKNGIINNGSYCLFENLDVYGCGDSGIQMKNGGNNTILNCDSHDNFDYKLDKSGDLTECDFGGNADGFADKQFTGAGNHYIGCRAWNNSDDGWDFFERISTSQTIIENCICYANGPAYYNMNGHARYETDKAWFDQFKNGLDVIDADGNPVHVTMSEYTNMGNGNGFKLGGKNTEHNVIVHHCLSVANTVKGYDQNNDAGTIYLYNNTAYKNGTNYGFPNANGCKLYIQNCIGLSGTNSNSLNSNVVQVNDHNTWNMNLSGSGGIKSKDMTLILTPRNADGSLAETDFMRLTDDSPLIDAGVNVGYAYNGSAPDLGCYESEQGESHGPTVLPSLANRIFYWQMSGTTAPANGATLTATGGYIRTNTTDATKTFDVESAYYVSSIIPEDMKANDGKGLKIGRNALYLTLSLNEGTFHKGDTLFICGFNVWDVGTSLNNIFDSICIDTIRISSKNYYDIGYLVLPTNAESLVLKRHRGKGTSASSIIVCRDPYYDPATALDRTKDYIPGKSEKILRDGQLFIRREDQLFTPTGQRVQ